MKPVNSVGRSVSGMMYFLGKSVCTANPIHTIMDMSHAFYPFGKHSGNINNTFLLKYFHKFPSLLFCVQAAPPDPEYIFLIRYICIMGPYLWNGNGRGWLNI